jgi:DNA-binding LytR/AlgR family response regulator
MQKVFVDDILYIEGMKNYLRIVTHKERIMTLSNFKNMEEVLPPEKFQRIHKSFLIALDKIDNIERNRVCIKDKMFPVSETYKEEFYKKIRDLSI